MQRSTVEDDASTLSSQQHSTYVATGQHQTDIIGYNIQAGDCSRTGPKVSVKVLIFDSPWQTEVTAAASAEVVVAAVNCCEHCSQRRGIDQDRPDKTPPEKTTMSSLREVSYRKKLNNLPRQARDKWKEKARKGTRTERSRFLLTTPPRPAPRVGALPRTTSGAAAADRRWPLSTPHVHSRIVLSQPASA